jgi:hypothetical protein
MSDFPLGVPERRGAGRQPQRAEHLWTMRKDSSTLRCELRSHGTLGVELQITKDGSAIFTRWYQDHEITIAEAEERRRLFEGEGWTIASE